MAEGPTRMTVRGGRDQFNWSSVKDDKHYQNYLGHSLMAPVGRWQKDKDLEWFSRDKSNDAGHPSDAALKSESDALREERRRIKEVEEEAVAEAMGVTLPSREERRAQADAEALVRRDAHGGRSPVNHERDDERRERRSTRHKRHGDDRRDDRRRRASYSRSRSREHNRSSTRDDAHGERRLHGDSRRHTERSSRRRRGEDRSRSRDRPSRRRDRSPSLSRHHSRRS